MRDKPVRPQDIHLVLAAIKKQQKAKAMKIAECDAEIARLTKMIPNAR